MSVTLQGWMIPTIVMILVWAYAFCAPPPGHGGVFCFMIGGGT